MRKRAKGILIAFKNESDQPRTMSASAHGVLGADGSAKLGPFLPAFDFCKHGNAFLGCKLCALEAEEE